MPYCKSCGIKLPEEAIYCPNCGMKSKQIRPKASVSKKLKISGWGERFVAWIIDSIILGAFLSPIKIFLLVAWPSFTWAPQFLRWIPFVDFVSMSVIFARFVNSDPEYFMVGSLLILVMYLVRGLEAIARGSVPHFNAYGFFIQEVIKVLVLRKYHYHKN